MSGRAGDAVTGTEWNGQAELSAFFAVIAQNQPDKEKILFICIGSDRSTGDSFGPIVGTLLKRQGWSRVIGTLEEPCDAYKVEAAAREAASLGTEEGLTVVAIDAGLGKPQLVGGFVAKEGPLQPGAATGRRLPPVGNYSIAGIVNINGPKAYWMLQTTSLHHVMRMADKVAAAVGAAWPPQEESSNGNERAELFEEAK